MIATRLILLLFLAAFAAGAVAQEESVLRDAGDVTVHLAGSETRGEPKVYIVQLREPSVAERQASLANKVAPRSLGFKPQLRLDRSSPSAKAYAAELELAQDTILAKAGAGTEKIYSYRYALNGFAARMTVAQAQKLDYLPEVLNVWEDEVRPMATRQSLSFLELFDADKGLRTAAGLDGDGVVIGVIDSGVTPGHPALLDTREADRPRACQASWGETTLLGRWLCRRYSKLPDVTNFDPPENWSGECIAGENFEASDCNNKMIGARWYIDGALATGLIDDGEIRSPRDADGHGTHVATTAAGNRTSAAIFGTTIGDLEGVAPRARIATYKACWLRPGSTRASCNTSDLAQAIDAAVADGVDIINYSVGSSLRRITAPDDVALMAATKAGVLTVVAAGNEGPNLGTIGSPAGAPWVITAAASSRDGELNVEAMEITAPSAVANRYAVQEASFTPPLEDVDPIEANLVLVDDDDTTLDTGGTGGSESDACQALVNGADIDGNIAFIQRTGCRFDDMVANAADAGAVAALVYNIAGDPIVMDGRTGLSDIPALMIGQADGNLLLAEIDAGNTVTAILDKGFLLTTSESGNEMGTFSARGPGPVADVLKPDVTAPGINILAGFSPDSAYSRSGEFFGYLTGTSMSTPHVAGVAALLRQAHPDWSPAALKSAMMTSARQNVTRPSGVGDAGPFDFGAGHIVPNDALEPGLVYDITDDEYDAYACGIASPAVTQARCDGLEAAGFSFAPRALNLPSIAISRLANTQTVTRRVTNVSDEAASYVAETSPPPGMTVAVVPGNISLAPGESANFDVTVTYESGPLDLWRFGSMTWRSDAHAVYTPIAVKPTSILAPAEITTSGGTDARSFEVEFGYSGSYSAGVHGLNLPLVLNGFVENDPDKTFEFSSTSIPGTTLHTISVPANQLYARFALFDALTDGDDDLDMYVYYCGLDGSSCVKLGESGEPTSQERFDVLRPAEGLYAVFVHGFETDAVQGGPGSNYQLLSWGVGIVDDKGNLSASGPAFVNAGSTGTVDFSWSGLISNTIYLGAISHNTPQGIAALTLITIIN
ncbi:MAG: S8 family serine peptidase [Woeseiaceae bacterium]|nr:S8 family serine peptidase [Woeseiaceae bacterium]